MLCGASFFYFRKNMEYFLMNSSFCTVSLRFVHYNFKEIEEICKSEPDNWKISLVSA